MRRLSNNDPRRTLGLDDLPGGMLSRISKTCYAADPRVKDVMIFGSYARSEARRGSDIDIAVTYEGAPDVRREVDRHVGAALSWMSREFDMPFDLVTLPEDFARHPENLIGRSVRKDGIHV